MSWDHEVIELDLTNLDEKTGERGTSQEVTCWRIKTLSDETRKKAPVDSHMAASELPKMREKSSREDIEEEDEWIESTFTRILDKHTLPR